jgi:hypothetical protein
MFEHALGGAFCDEDAKARLRQLGEAFDWESAAATGSSEFAGGWVERHG